MHLSPRVAKKVWSAVRIIAVAFFPRIITTALPFPCLPGQSFALLAQGLRERKDVRILFSDSPCPGFVQEVRHAAVLAMQTPEPHQCVCSSGRSLSCCEVPRRIQGRSCPALSEIQTGLAGTQRAGSRSSALCTTIWFLMYNYNYIIYYRQPFWGVASCCGASDVGSLPCRSGACAWTACATRALAAAMSRTSLNPTPLTLNPHSKRGPSSAMPALCEPVAIVWFFFVLSSPALAEDRRLESLNSRLSGGSCELCLGSWGFPKIGDPNKVPPNGRILVTRTSK